MKKLLTFIIAAVMLLSLAACAAKDGGNSDIDETDPDSENTEIGAGENTAPEDTEGDADKADEPDAPEDSSGQLSDIMSTILDGVENLPAIQDIPLDSSNFEFYAFVPYDSDYNGLASEAMMNAIAHSVVLVQVPDGTDAEAVAEEIEANADPRKWICVEAEKTVVSVNGSLILLVMSTESIADAVTENFLALS
ncbi:MAG: hypothetical protein ACI3VB_03110 [Oscillospiraceae bacterium]